jgi:outer membrane receptor protein involved in Fe transport
LLAANPTIQISNVGSEEIYGLEEEVTYLMTDGLELGANAGWTHVRCSQTPAACISANNTALANQRPVGTPKWNAAVSAQYDTQELSFGGHARFRVDGVYVSDQNWLASPPTSAIEQAAITSKGSWTVNMRAGIVEVPLGDTDATGSVSLWGSNIFNNRRLNFAFSVGDAAVGTFTPPAMFGVDLTVKY